MAVGAVYHSMTVGLRKVVVVNAWDDLFFLLFLCLPLTQFICKCEVIVTLLFRFELKQGWLIWKNYALLRVINEALKNPVRSAADQLKLLALFIMTVSLTELGGGLVPFGSHFITFKHICHIV